MISIKCNILSLKIYFTIYQKISKIQEEEEFNSSPYLYHEIMILETKQSRIYVSDCVPVGIDLF